MKGVRQLRRRAVASVEVATVVSVTLALGTWAALGQLVPEQAGPGRGPALIAMGVFALTMFVWSRLRHRSAVSA